MEKVKIAFKEMNKDLVFKEIRRDYESISNLIGGYIEFVPSGINGLHIVVNEEGKLLNLTPNLYYGREDILCGNIIFVRTNEEGDLTSITSEDEEILKDVIPKITIPKDESIILADNIDSFLRCKIIGFN